jgi:nucleotide-binding universal stress UspA family protein
MALNKILVAHDFSEPANRALAFAADLAAQVGTSLEVVHVHPDVYDGHGTPALGTPWPTHGQEERYMRFLHEEVQRTVRGVLGERAVHVKHHVVRGDPVKRIPALATETGADLICIGSTGKGAVERVLLGSVSQLIVRTSPIPVLTVH